MTAGGADVPSERLERALAVWLEFVESGARDPERLLAAHPELKDQLQAMLGRADADAVGDDDGGEVLGDFRLVRELGRGGMGIVHEAWQRSLDRRVALKVLSPALSASPAAVARFRREAAAVGRLRHQGIVEVYGLHGDGHRHWFAMGFVDGEPLWRCAQRFAEPAAAVALVCQIADALQHAHAHGIVHRDVKPGNVLVRADGSAVLTDFGLAHDTDLPSVTTEGSFLGTLDYASPEQVQGMPVDARTDIWSLGVVLYELLARRRPFARDGATATMKAILADDPPSLRRVCPAVTPDLAAIVDRALQKEPARRYASALAMLADLRAWQSGGIVSVRAPSAVERLMRWTRREPWRATAIAVAMVALPLTAGLIAYVRANSERIAAATLAENDARREELIALVWERSMAGDGAGMMRAIDEMPPGGEEREIVIWRAFALRSLGRNAEALALLVDRQDTLATFLRARIDGHNPDIFAVPTADLDAFGCYVIASAILSDAKNLKVIREHSRRAFELATLAVTLSSKPRLCNLLVWADAAALTKDVPAMAAAAGALLRHFPDQHLSLDRRGMLLQDIDPEQSLELLARAWKGREDATYHNNRGTRLLQLRRWKEAEQELRLATQQNPDYPLAWLNLGTVLRRLDRLDESEVAARRATELESTSRAWGGLGLTLTRLGRVKEACDAYRQAITIEPRYAVGLNNLADAEQHLGDLAAAEAGFRRAIAADPQYFIPRRGLAGVLQIAGRFEEAVVAYVQAASLGPDDVAVQSGLAESAIECRLAIVAQRAAERAVELGDSVARRILLARAKALAGDVAGALATLDAAEHEPKLAGDGDRGAIAAWREQLGTK